MCFIIYIKPQNFQVIIIIFIFFSSTTIFLKFELLDLITYC